MASVSRTATRSLLRATSRNVSVRSLSHSSSSSSSSASTSSSTPGAPSSSATAAWQPLLPPGVLPAYDEALSFLSSHSASLAAKIATVDTDHASLSADERAALKESLEIAAAINDPAMLAAFQASSPTGYDARNPAFRHLRERVWRKDSGVLEKVMQRCTLMHVLPDVIPAITPTVDVQLAFGEGDGFTDHQSNGGDVLVGAFVPASASITPPKLDVTVFHTQPKRYTLAIVDPDQPDEQNQCFTTSLLALKHDVELSATAHSSIDLASNMVAEYIPPHPQQGSNYHRYTVLLFEQPSSPSSEQSAIDIAKNRHNFQLANYISTHNLVPAGIHFWRAKWSPDSADAISTIYRDILKQPEPKYSKPPTLDKVRKQIGDIGSKWF